MAWPRTYPESIDATLTVHTAAIDQVVRASREAGIDSVLPQALLDVYRRAVAAGSWLRDPPSLYGAFVPH
jgi:hypothetical protein